LIGREAGNAEIEEDAGKKCLLMRNNPADVHRQVIYYIYLRMVAVNPFPARLRWSAPAEPNSAVHGFKPIDQSALKPADELRDLSDFRSLSISKGS
jgi:hypothetical protein